MADIRLGRLFVRIGLEDAELEKGLDRAKKKADRFSGAIRKAFAFAGVSIGLQQIVSQTERAIARLDNIGKTADKIGLTTKSLQELRFAADQSGVSANTLDMAIQRFTRRTAEAAKGTGEAKDALKQMGIQLTDSNGVMRSTDDLLNDVSAALQNTTSDAERVRLAFKLFDSEGVAMINTLKQGPDQLKAWREEAQRLGLVLSEQMIRKGEEMQDKLSQAQQMVGVEMTKAFVNFGDALVGATKAIAGLIRWINRAIVAAKQLSFLLDKDVQEFRRLSKAIEFNEKQLKSAQATMASMIELHGKESAVVQGQRAEIERLTEETERLTKAREELAKLLLPRFEETAGTDIPEDPRTKPTAQPVGLSDEERTKQEDFFRQSAEMLAAKEDQAKQELTLLEETLLTEKELEEKRHEERLKRLEEAKLNEFETILGHDELLRREKEQHEKALNEIEERNQAIRRAKLMSHLNATRGLLDETAGALEAFGLKNHAVQKAFAISSALIDTYQAIAKAQAAAPPPLSYALMAIAAIRGFAQVAAIARQQPKGHGSGAGAAAATAGGGGAAGAAAAQAGQQQTVFIEGIDPNSLFQGSSVKTLINTLIEAQKDGAKIVVD